MKWILAIWLMLLCACEVEELGDKVEPAMVELAIAAKQDDDSLRATVNGENAGKENFSAKQSHFEWDQESELLQILAAEQSSRVVEDTSTLEGERERLYIRQIAISVVGFRSDLLGFQFNAELNDAMADAVSAPTSVSSATEGYSSAVFSFGLDGLAATEFYCAEGYATITSLETDEEAGASIQGEFSYPSCRAADGSAASLSLSEGEFSISQAD